jgi:hypothetical protein
MEEFIKMVSNMRDLQKQYFRSRDPHTLQACKKAETEVDTFIHLNTDQSSVKPPVEKDHPTLF